MLRLVPFENKVAETGVEYIGPKGALLVITKEKKSCIGLKFNVLQRRQLELFEWGLCSMSHFHNLTFLRIWFSSGFDALLWI